MRTLSWERTLSLNFAIHKNVIINLWNLHYQVDCSAASTDFNQLLFNQHHTIIWLLRRLGLTMRQRSAPHTLPWISFSRLNIFNATLHPPSQRNRSHCHPSALSSLFSPGGNRTYTPSKSISLPHNTTFPILPPLDLLFPLSLLHLLPSSSSSPFCLFPLLSSAPSATFHAYQRGGITNMGPHGQNSWTLSLTHQSIHLCSEADSPRTNSTNGLSTLEGEVATPNNTLSGVLPPLSYTLSAPARWFRDETQGLATVWLLLLLVGGTERVSQIWEIRRGVAS